MSERERRVLARIERHIAETDPRLARMLALHRHPEHSSPVTLLVVGLGLMLLGSVTAIVGLVAIGAFTSLAALGMAAIRSMGVPRFA